MVKAGEETGTLANEQKVGEILIEMTPAKRAAAIRLNVKWAGTEEGVTYGVFISEDGLALVGIRAISTQQTPSVVTAGGGRLDFGKILEIFPSQGVALMKFNHRPKVWIPLARMEPEVGETIALIALKPDAPHFGDCPPVVGPVMAKRSTIPPRLSVPQFVRLLSLGARLSYEQRAMVGDGCFAINEKGELVAVLMGTMMSPSQTLINLYPVAAVADQVGEIAKRGKALEYPLTEDMNPLDPGLLHPDYHRLQQALSRRDATTARPILEALLKRFPESHSFRFLAAAEPSFSDPDKPLAGLKWFPAPDPNDPNKARQVGQFIARGHILINARDIAAGIRELEAACRLSPKEFPEARENLASAYLESGRPTDAEKLFKEIYPVFSDASSYVERYELLSIRLGSKEADKLSNRVHELEEIYH